MRLVRHGECTVNGGLRACMRITFLKAFVKLCSQALVCDSNQDCHKFAKKRTTLEGEVSYSINVHPHTTL